MAFLRLLPATPIVFAEEKEVSRHFYVGYGKLNNVTIDDSYPLFRKDYFINRQGKRQRFQRWPIIRGLGKSNSTNTAATRGLLPRTMGYTDLKELLSS